MKDTGEIVNALIGCLKSPKMKFVFIPIYWIICPFYKLICKIPFFQIMNITFEIERLERQGRIDEARTLRKSWIENPKFSQSAELLCSEGKDLLYNKQDYQNSLIAFEKAIKSDPYYHPIEVYYGASCAALMVKDHVKAKEHYISFVEWWEKFKKDPKLNELLENRYSDCKKWLEESIGMNPKDVS